MYDEQALNRYMLQTIAAAQVLDRRDLEWLAKLLTRSDKRLEPQLMMAQLCEMCEKFIADSNAGGLTPLASFKRQHDISMLFNFMKQTQFDQPQILVGVPQRRRLTPEGQPPPNLGVFIVPQPIRIEAASCYGLGHCEAREYFADRALKDGKWTHVLFMDDDNLLPLNFVMRALQTRLPIVGALYFKKSALDETIATAVTPDSLDAWQQWGVDAVRPSETPAEPVPVNCTGLGCLLVSRKALMRVQAMRKPEPIFHFVYEAGKEEGTQGPLVGEDSQFCRDAIACGVQPYVLPDIISPHCSFEESAKLKRPVFYGPSWVVDKEHRLLEPQKYTRFEVDPGLLYTPYDNNNVFGKGKPKQEAA